MDSPYTVLPNLYFCTQNLLPICALSWKLHFCEKKVPARIENCLSIEIFEKNFRTRKSNFLSVYRHTKPNNLWAKVMILGSADQLFLCQYGGFDVSYPSSFHICAVSLGMLRNLMRVEQGREEKVECCSSGICWLVKWCFLLFMSGEGHVPSSQTLQSKVLKR